MYTDTITLFNRYKSSTGDIWYPSILHNVNVNMDKAAIIAKYGAESQNKAVLNVKYRIEDGEKMVGDKKWLPPKEWKNQEERLLTTSLTFSSGQSFDFFIVGEYESESPIADNDFKDGFYNHLNTKHDFVYAITEATFYSVIPHFEITAK